MLFEGWGGGGGVGVGGGGRGEEQFHPVLKYEALSVSFLLFIKMGIADDQLASFH